MRLPVTRPAVTRPAASRLAATLILLALGCGLLLSGCGQKGPLVLPPDNPAPAAPR